MQTYIRVMLLSVLLMVLSTVLCGCWNYREIDKMSIVAGLAVDKSEDNQYSVTVEVVDIKGGADIRILPRTITSHGETVFDTIRNTISLSGKRLFWSHTKVLILSKAIASDDIVKILDWYIRDSETRGEINIIVSKESTAKEILESKAITDEVVSYKLNDMIEGEKSVSKAPIISIYDFITDLAGNGISPIAPMVGLEKSNGKKNPSISGCALFAKSKLIDFLDANDTKDLLFVRDMIKGGVLVQSENGQNGQTNITLEIFKNKTDLKPILTDGNVEMQVNIQTTVTIDEIQGTDHLVDEQGIQKLKQDAEQKMKDSIERVVKKVQSEYGADVFGFGAKIKQDFPKQWKELQPVWQEKFKELKVTVHPKIMIKNSAAMYKTLPIGE